VPALELVDTVGLPTSYPYGTHPNRVAAIKAAESRIGRTTHE
jgi:hypothetical protein